MTTEPLTLAGFLTERYDVLESVAHDMQDQSRLGRPLIELLGGGTGIRQLTSPDYVLADIEAKRQIVELVPYLSEPGRRGDILRLLALPFADHPDYREEWKP